MTAEQFNRWSFTYQHMIEAKITQRVARGHG
jgi:hypothetical protein